MYVCLSRFKRNLKNIGIRYTNILCKIVFYCTDCKKYVSFLNKPMYIKNYLDLTAIYAGYQASPIYSGNQSLSLILFYFKNEEIMSPFSVVSAHFKVRFTDHYA